MGREGQGEYGALGFFFLLSTASQFCCYYYCFARFCASEILGGMATSLQFIIFLVSSYVQRMSRPWFISFLRTFKNGHSMRGGTIFRQYGTDFQRRHTKMIHKPWR